MELATGMKKISISIVSYLHNLQSSAEEGVALVKGLDSVDDQLINKLIDTLEEL